MTGTHAEKGRPKTASEGCCVRKHKPVVLPTQDAQEDIRQDPGLSQEERDLFEPDSPEYDGEDVAPLEDMFKDTYEPAGWGDDL